jgi:hypothetical protein
MRVAMIHAFDLRDLIGPVAEARPRFGCDLRADRLMLLALLHEAEIVEIGRRAERQQRLAGDTFLSGQALDRHRHVIARMRHRMVAQQRRQLALQALQRIRA